MPFSPTVQLKFAEARRVVESNGGSLSFFTDRDHNTLYLAGVHPRFNRKTNPNLTTTGSQEVVEENKREGHQEFRAALRKLRDALLFGTNSRYVRVLDGSETAGGVRKIQNAYFPPGHVPGDDAFSMAFVFSTQEQLQEFAAMLKADGEQHAPRPLKVVETAQREARAAPAAAMRATPEQVQKGFIVHYALASDKPPHTMTISSTVLPGRDVHISHRISAAKAAHMLIFPQLTSSQRFGMQPNQSFGTYYVQGISGDQLAKLRAVLHENGIMERKPQKAKKK